MSAQDGGEIRFIDFHRSANRRAYFDGGRRGIAYDAALHRWIVDEPALATEILGDPRFQTADYEGVCQHMAAIGRPVESLALAYANIPLCHDGDRHRALRRSMSEHLAAKRREIVPDLRALVERHLRALARPGPVELMGEVLAPLVDDFMGRLVDAVIDDAKALAALSPAFDHLMGERKLLQTDAYIAKVRQIIRDALPEDGRDAEGRNLALLMLGRDPLLGSLGESLRHLFETPGAMRTGAIDFPALPPETGVPYIERIAGEDCTLAGVEIAAGARLRILLQTYAYVGEERDRLRMFGVGSHACLGRPLALDLWKELTSQLRSLNAGILFKQSAPRVSDYVFTCPQFIRIEVTA